MIRSFLRGEQNNWDQHLRCLSAAYKSTIHESTGLTPNMMMLGREVRTPAEIMYGSNTTLEGNITNYGTFVDHLRERMQKAHRVARKHLKKAAERQKHGYETKLNLYQYKPGDAIWYLNEIRK